jgi:VIT1/CCC1 family predicted Fe2+/Mn2+ transporter
MAVPMGGRAVSDRAADSDERTQHERLLDPIDRISEVLFGLIMAVTIVGSLSIASAGRAEVRTVLLAALGCNVAWGLVDAVMYVVRAATERSRLRVLAGRVRVAGAAQGRHLIATALPDHLATVVGPDEIEAMRARLVARAPQAGALLHPRDFLEAAAVFAVVVLATFPVVLPFVFADDVARAMRYSQGITVVMLFFAGAALARHAGRPRPLWTGLYMAVFGVGLIAAVKALGG